MEDTMAKADACLITPESPPAHRASGVSPADAFTARVLVYEPARPVPSTAELGAIIADFQATLDEMGSILAEVRAIVAMPAGTVRS
jgi:hypothetical protein